MRINKQLVAVGIVTLATVISGCSSSSEQPQANQLAGAIGVIATALAKETVSYLESVEPLLLATAEFYDSHSRWPNSEEEITTFIASTKQDYDLTRISSVHYETNEERALIIRFTVETDRGPIETSLTIEGDEVEDVSQVIESHIAAERKSLEKSLKK